MLFFYGFLFCAHFFFFFFLFLLKCSGANLFSLWLIMYRNIKLTYWKALYPKALCYKLAIMAARGYWKLFKLKIYDAVFAPVLINLILRASVTNDPCVFIGTCEHYLHMKRFIIFSIGFINKIFYIFYISWSFNSHFLL